MSTHILSACWKLSGMSSTQKIVLISLADQANDDGVCWPSVRKMSERTCLSDRAVRGAIAWLVDAKILKSDQRFNTSNVYTITPEQYSPPAPRAVPPAPRAVPPAPRAVPPAPRAVPPLHDVPTNHHLEPTENHQFTTTAERDDERAAQSPELTCNNRTPNQPKPQEQTIMSVTWEPSSGFGARLVRAGKKPDLLTRELLAKFCAYYDGQERRQSQWEAELLSWVCLELSQDQKPTKSKAAKSGGIKNKYVNINDRNYGESGSF